MTQLDAKYDKYELDYDVALANSSEAMKEFKRNAWNSFCDVGMPIARKGNEKWKYTNVGPVLNNEYRIDPQSRTINQVQELGFSSPLRIKVVMINGKLSEEMSSLPDSIPGIMITSLEKALTAGSEFVKNNLSKHVSYSDGFVALNSALFDEGLYIEVGSNNPDICVEVINITGGSENVASYPRLLLNVKDNASVLLSEAFFSEGEQKHFTNAVTEVILGRNSSLTHNRVMFESMDSVHMGVTNVVQYEKSDLKSSTFSNGSNLSRNEMSVLLDGEEASCDLIGLYLTVGDQHIDNLINIDHAKPNCSSNIVYKGILDGESRAVFGGEVLVRKDSQKTNATQSDKNLILSEGAEVDSKPSLMIYADDVQCGHGATAGSINDETVFYMRSRGLDEKTASKFLIQAFAREIIEQLDDKGFMEYIDNAYEASIPNVTLNLG